MEKKSYSLINKIYSHPDKLLTEHLERVWKIASFHAPSFFSENDRKALKIITLLHDIGKATSFFQEYLFAEENKRTVLKNDPKTRHSLISALFGYFTAKKVFSGETPYPILIFMAIKFHHSDLSNLRNAFHIDKGDIIAMQLDAIEENTGKEIYKLLNMNVSFCKIKEAILGWEDEFRSLRRSLRREEGKTLDLFFMLNIFFSLLVDADKLEAGVREFIPKHVFIEDDIVDAYREKRGWIWSKDSINRLRNKIYEEVIHSAKNIKESGILSLNVPTGLGKTLTAFSLALKLKSKFNLSRIIYSLPFLSIIEQNFEAIKDVWIKVKENSPTEDILLKHHHLSDISYKTKNEEYEPDEEKLLIESWNTQIVVTTFIQLFHTLVGYKNRTLKKFNKMLNSIIILDEIQSIPTKYWDLLKEVLTYLVEKENCFIIFVTATKPMIVESIKELVKDPDIYFTSLSRYIVYPELNKNKIEQIIDMIEEELKEERSVLVILNTIGSAKELYEALPKNKKVKYFYLSTHITPYQRFERIKEIRKYKGKKVVVSTQLIEAGVDIDLDVVIRDIAPLDSLQQSAGRCNRNGKLNKGIVRIVNLCDEQNRRYATKIYDGVLIRTTEEVLPSESFEEAEFFNILQNYYNLLKERVAQEKDIIKSLYELNYDDGPDAISSFALIKEQEKVDIFIELNDEAKQVWKQYAELKSIKDRWKRKIEFDKLKLTFYKYVISVFSSQAIKNLPPEENGMRYVSRSILDEYYDLKTGFKREGITALW